MADFLRFKGSRDVSKQTGDEMRLRRPPRGGTTFRTKRWWGGKGNTVYITAAIFRVQSTAGVLSLVIPTDNETTALNIRHDGAGGFTFSDYRGVDRVAVYNDDRSVLYTEYQFPKISGGSVLKRIVQSLEPATTIGSLSIAGSTSPTYGSDQHLYTVVADGDAEDLTYAWNISGNGTIVSGANTDEITVTFDSADTATIGVTVTSATSSDSPAERILSISPVAPVVEETYDQLAARADLTVAVTVQDVDGSNKYFIDGVETDAITATIGSVVVFDQSDASNSGHPLRLYTDASKTTEITVGVTLKPGGGGLAFEPVIAGSFSYQCSAHAAMGGDLTVTS